MSSNALLLEGAVAGHMNHIYDNGEMTFGELKQLLQASADGKLRGTEKTDGQNIFLSFDVKTGRAVAARNQGQIKTGGLDVDELDSFFANHPSQALRSSFVEALDAFGNVIKDLDFETQEKIFGPDTNVFFNTEVMNPGTPGLEKGDPRGVGTTNVIPYDKKTLLIHRVGHGAFNKETGKKLDIDVSNNFEVLEKSLVGKSTDDATIFSVETNPIVRLPGLKDRKVLKDTLDAVNNLMADIEINDSNTINDYVIAQAVPEIEQFGLDDNLNRMILKRVMNIPDPNGKVPTLTQIVKGMPTELKQEVSNYVKSFKYPSYTLDLQRVLHDFSVAMVDGVKSSFIQNNEKQIQFLQNTVKDSISKIQGSSNERAKQELEKQLIKLKNVKNINTPSEGFVFDYNGVTYKFTGNFAPTNQILGMERFQRFGPIEPQEGTESPSEGDSRPRIAIVPGAFKPPHKGHLAMVERLADVADKVIVIISRPTKAGRALPSGKVIDSDHAEQIWRAYLDKSPAGSKTEVIQSPAASPVAVTYDFVMKEPDPNNPLVAPPNATIVLGCGDKEDDQGRYRGIANKAREDLDIKIQVCPMVVKHSNEYMQLIKNNPTISQYIPSVTKTTVDSSDFHASDMRSIIDLATQDPVGLELLKDFVPRPEDALAVLGALGLNPADSSRPEEDQVEEPEIDAENLKEIIENTVECLLQEGFKAQRPPKAGPSNSKFQKRMRKRLSKSHKTYLDMGRHDLTKHGGGFHLDRVKDKSNSFLAEDQEEIEEMSSMAAGNVAGYAAPLGTIREDEELKEQEKDLRKFIRLGIKEFFETKKKERQDLIEYVIQEHELRLSLRNMILEQEAPNIDGSDSTGINTLKDFMKNTNVLATLREVYKTLTTDEDQRRSFRAHIIAWIRDTLAPVKLNDIKPGAIAEQIGVDIEGVADETVPGDEDKFIDATDGSEKEQPQEPEEEEKMKPISGADTTGRNKAERIYPTIEKSIVDYYGELDNPEDQEMFYDYLIANIKLYFDKWENEMSETPPEEPTNDEYEQAKNPEETPGLSAS